jgi:hypothetical protein
MSIAVVTGDFPSRGVWGSHAVARLAPRARLSRARQQKGPIGGHATDSAHLCPFFPAPIGRRSITMSRHSSWDNGGAL